MSPQRVLVAHSSSELYGSDRQLLESVRALQARGCSCTVALPEHGPLVELLEQAGADVHVVETLVLRKSDVSPVGLLRVLLTLLRVLPGNAALLRRTRPDVVYVNTVNIPVWLPLARLMRVPALCHVHEAEEGLPHVVALALALPLLLARSVVVNSRAALGLLLQACPRLAGRAVVVYNGVPGPPAGAAPLPDRPGDPARLVLVGRLAPRKGTDTAVAAVAELHRRGRAVCLVLVGSPAPGLEAYADELHAQVAREGLGDAVSFAGFDTDVWPHYAAADVVLVPSRIEPFGNVAVEAALAGRPAVASQVQGLQEIVVHGATGALVPAGDALALADAVDDLLADWPQAQAWAARARPEAARRFGVERYGDELLAALGGDPPVATSGPTVAAAPDARQPAGPSPVRPQNLDHPVAAAGHSGRSQPEDPQ